MTKAILETSRVHQLRYLCLYHRCQFCKTIIIDSYANSCLV